MTQQTVPLVRPCAASPTVRFGSRKGQAGLFVVFNLGLLLGALGLAVDVGWAYFSKVKAQSAADAAAMAAATFATNGGPITCGSNNVTCASDTACAYPNTSENDTFTAGCLYAAANGFVNHGDQKVTMSGNTTSPGGITGNTPAYWVKATVSVSPHTFFGPFAGISQFTINASSTAAVAYYSAGACIYVLDPIASGALSAAGTTDVVATCGIFVNSNSSSAMSVTGNATITSTQILVNGSSSIGSNASVAPTPTNHAGAQTDPLSSLTMPEVENSCDYTNYSLSSGATATLSHGTYCGGINISGANVTFNPGMYILNGGGLSIGGNANVSGSGVTFFDTGQYAHNAGPVSMDGNSTINLSGPNTGIYKGILFLQDRTITYGGTNTFNGTSGSSLTGTLYFPTTAVKYTGTTATGTYTALIARTVVFTGTSDFKNDPTGFYTGLGTTIRGLIQ